MDKSKNPVLFAADCVEQVLPIFESAYPTDDRPRKAIEAARSGASVPAARAAAVATIHAAAHAPHAAAYAAKAALEVKKRSEGLRRQ
jgi:hypothetical protein